MKNKIQKIKKENNSLDLLNYQPLLAELSKILENQRISKKKQNQILETSQRGFVGLALRNEKLLKANDQLKQQLDEVLKELNAVKQEREEKAERQEKWANRRRLPKRDPINSEIYKLLIQESDGPSFVATRTRVAICVITVTGIRISELLPLKVNQLQTLLKESWIEIDRLKRGPANHRAFLNKEGKRIVKARERDFDALFLMKEKDSYVFTSDRNPNQMLQRQTLTTDVNKITKMASQRLPEKPNITSHSFRIGYITKLWKDTKDIEFVRQTIGHRKLNSTSAYVNKLSNQERRDRIEQL